MDFQKIADQRVLPAAVVPTAKHAVPLARALGEAGMRVMEVTFRSDDSPEAVRQIREAMPEMACGAGTLLSTDDVDRALAAGAQFGLSPGFNPKVVRYAAEKGLPFIPGVQTCGEMEQAMDLGCFWVKFFPAAAAGGPAFLKAVSAPYAHTGLRFIPLGGIGPDNMNDYLELELVPAVGGSWLASKSLLQDEKYDEITRLAKDALG